MNLLKWILFPGAMVVLRMGDEGGGGSGDAASADEGRKTALRTRINKLYGIGGKVPIYGDAPAPTANLVSHASDIQGDGGGGSSPIADGTFSTPERPIIGYQDDPEAAAARTQMDAEDKQVGDATRGYYTDQLTRSFGAAERNNRFNLARTGQMGGSNDIDTNANLQTDENLGATRIDQAARGASANLEAQREQERLNAVNLVNAGAGDDAVVSAQRGLKNSLDLANSTQRANLFGDLFTNSADAFSGSANAQAMSAMLGRYQQQLGAFFPTSSGGSGGRVTPSA